TVTVNAKARGNVFEAGPGHDLVRKRVLADRDPVWIEHDRARASRRRHGGKLAETVVDVGDDALAFAPIAQYLRHVEILLADAVDAFRHIEFHERDGGALDQRDRGARRIDAGDHEVRT